MKDDPIDYSRPVAGRSRSPRSASSSTCADDLTPKGVRDAAMLAIFYGTGVRRGELARLDLDDFDPLDCSIKIHGKGNKMRTVYLTEQGCELVEAWIRRRGDGAGPLFCPVGQRGAVRVSRMRGESITYILRRRQEQAGTEGSQRRRHRADLFNLSPPPGDKLHQDAARERCVAGRPNNEAWRTGHGSHLHRRRGSRTG
jgi:integrase